jgi:hypothetical protein
VGEKDQCAKIKNISAPPTATHRTSEIVTNQVSRFMMQAWGPKPIALSI